jgi:hypothetical protein
VRWRTYRFDASAQLPEPMDSALVVSWKPRWNFSMAQAFHVDHHGAHWHVVDADGRVIGHRDGQVEAIELAIREAQQISDDAVVCVEQPDGHYTLAWSSS